MSSLSRVLLGLLVLGASCAGARPQASSEIPPAGEQGKASPKQAPSPKKPAKAEPRAEREAARKAKPGPKSEPSEPSACPSGMLLVDGEYCSDVEHRCKKSWYDKNNRKKVCEEFEPWSKCKGDKTKKRFCIDRYTFPNEKGARPEVMNRFHQAQLKCAAVGKRLCTESEWTMACEGPKMLPFPYGYVRDTNKCHGDVTWDHPDMKKVAARDPSELARLWKGVRNGSQPECVSDYGVADLPGNVDEVVASESYRLPGYKGKFDSIHTGGPWYRGVRNQCRPKIHTHDEGFYYYFLGFRCCGEPDGKATDPRTPQQVEKGWKLERVERSAGFTLAEIKDKLELKARGECRCDSGDILCKTMCGSLLGPEAKDFK